MTHLAPSPVLSHCAWPGPIPAPCPPSLPPQDFTLAPNVRATTNAFEAISGAQYAVHAVPVQSSRECEIIFMFAVVVSSVVWRFGHDTT